MHNRCILFAQSANMSAIDGPDFCQPKIRNFANICKFHQPTRCYMYMLLLLKSHALDQLSAELSGYKLDIAILTETACHEPFIIVKDCSSSTEVLIGGDDRFPGLRRASWENYVRRHLALYRRLFGR